MVLVKIGTPSNRAYSSLQLERLNLPYFIPNQALVKPLEKESGYLPDVLILNRANLAANLYGKNLQLLLKVHQSL